LSGSAALKGPSALKGRHSFGEFFAGRAEVGPDALCVKQPVRARQDPRHGKIIRMPTRA